MHEKYKIITPISRVPVCHPAIFFDDCNGTFNYAAAGDGADWTAEYNTEAAHSGLKGIRLSTKTTTPTSSDVVSISKLLWLPPTQMFTLDLLFKNIIEAEYFDITMGCTWYDGTNANIALLHFTSSDRTVGYYSGPAAYTDIPELKFCPTWKVWNHLRASVNLQRQAWQFIEVNNNVADGRNFTIPQGVDATVAHLLLWIVVATSTAAIASIDFDHILLMPGNP